MRYRYYNRVKHAVYSVWKHEMGNAAQKKKEKRKKPRERITYSCLFTLLLLVIRESSFIRRPEVIGDILVVPRSGVWRRLCLGLGGDFNRVLRERPQIPGRWLSLPLPLVVPTISTASCDIASFAASVINSSLRIIAPIRHVNSTLGDKN